MRLYFLRHGPAGVHGDPAWPNDDERPLTPKGRRRTTLAVRGIRAMNLAIDTIISSPLARAQQTAEIARVGLRLDTGALRLCLALSPGGLFEALVDELLKEQPDSGVMLVGHEPDLSRTISRFLCDDPDRLSLQLKKSALCGVLAPPLPAKQNSSLLFLVQPAQLRNIR